MTIGEKIASLCALHRIDQRSLAERIGTSPASISRIVNDLTEPRLHQALKIARVFGVPVDTLLEESEEHQPTGRTMCLEGPEPQILRMVRTLGTDESWRRLLKASRPGRPDPRRTDTPNPAAPTPPNPDPLSAR